MVVASPVLRPDAETTPNRLGATLADLRAAMEEAVQARIDGGDDAIVLIPGADVITAAHLADGIHPGDEGQARLAEVFGAASAPARRPGRTGQRGLSGGRVPVGGAGGHGDRLPGVAARGSPSASPSWPAPWACPRPPPTGCAPR